jgi:hypothetical protein
VKTLNKGKKEFMMKTQGMIAWTELTEGEQKVRVEKPPSEKTRSEKLSPAHPRGRGCGIATAILRERTSYSRMKSTLKKTPF